MSNRGLVLSFYRREADKLLPHSVFHPHVEKGDCCAGGEGGGEGAGSYYTLQLLMAGARAWETEFSHGPVLGVCAWLVAATCCPRAVLCLLKTHPRALAHDFFFFFLNKIFKK